MLSRMRLHSSRLMTPHDDFDRMKDMLKSFKGTPLRNYMLLLVIDL
jgi:hypothetical protein